MKVFLSWAGDESRYVAETLKFWLPQVLQSLDPWMSTHIEKGEAWDDAIAEGLHDTPVGILCLTKESIKSNYLHYEAGAIANVPKAKVCTFLFGVSNADVSQPLGRFQNTKFEKDELLKLLKTINSKLVECKERALTDEQLVKSLNLNWVELTQQLEKAPKGSTIEVKRSDREILEEILQTVRTGTTLNRSSDSRYVEKSYKQVFNQPQYIDRMHRILFVKSIIRDYQEKTGIMLEDALNKVPDIVRYGNSNSSSLDDLDPDETFHCVRLMINERNDSKLEP